MKRIPALATIASLAFLAALAACSSTGDPVGEADAGASGDAGLSADAAAARDAGIPADAGASKDAGSGRDGGEVVVLTGTVSSLSTTNVATPLSGATVEIVGVNPAHSTTTGSDGSYSLSVAPGTYFVRASNEGMVSAQVGVVTSQSTTVTELSLLSEELASFAATWLSITLDPGKGIVVVGFETSDTGGGYSATLSPQPGSSFALSAQGRPLSVSVTQRGGQNALFFTNVPPGTTTVSFSGPSDHRCAAQLPIDAYRVDANVVTAIRATCD